MQLYRLIILYILFLNKWSQLVADKRLVMIPISFNNEYKQWTFTWVNYLMKIDPWLTTAGIAECKKFTSQLFTL